VGGQRHGGSSVALATVADLAMASAVRGRLGTGMRLATATLSVHHLAAPAPGPVTADAVALHAQGGGHGGFASCELRDAQGSLSGLAEGWFVALPAPAGRPLPAVPWESRDTQAVVQLCRQDLDEVESAAVTAAVAAGVRATVTGAPVSEELLNLSYTGDGGEVRTGEMALGPEHVNRAGTVQGGVLYGAAARTAAQLCGSGSRVLDGHLQLLRPAEGPVLTCVVTLLRRGRRTVSCEVRLSTGTIVVAVGQFTASG